MYLIRRLTVLLICLLAGLPVQAQILLSNVKIVDVTPSSFSVIWYADQVSEPGIRIFSDVAGTADITSNFEVVAYPVRGLDPLITSRYEYLTKKQQFVDSLKSQGLMMVQVRGLAPETTYNFRVTATGSTDSGFWPAADTAQVTTQKENSWVTDARQLIIDFNLSGASGWPVMVSAAGSSYPVSALIEDGAGTAQAAVNVANLFAFDGRNWHSTNTETLTIELLKGNGELLSSNVDVLLSPDFTVASNQVVAFSTAFNGYLQMTSPGSDVYTTAGSVALAWLDEVVGVNGIISLYYDTDNTGTDGTLIATAINEDSDGAGDTYSWDISTMSDGQYYVYATLTDGASTIDSYASGRITIDKARLDGDGDGMSNLWELFYFDTLSRDGSGDFDLDGRTDLQEYLDGTSPLEVNGITAPVILSPLPGSETGVLRPQLQFRNSAHTPDTSASYTCEVYADAAMTQLVESISNVAEGPGTTSCQLTADLQDDRRYYWRVRGAISTLNSRWHSGSFFVNTAGNAPQAPVGLQPRNGATITSLQPLLEVANAIDAESDNISYRFRLYADAALTIPVMSSPVITEADGATTRWLVTAPLTDNTTYYWQASATDENGNTAYSSAASFSISSTAYVPGLPAILAPANGSELAASTVSLSVTNAVDPLGLPLTYRFELDTRASFDSPALQVSGDIPENPAGTAWTPPSALTENTRYYWRVMASNGSTASGWVMASFFYNTANEAPSVPVTDNPDATSWTETTTPTLTVRPAADPDNDSVTYQFELYDDAQMTVLREQATLSDIRWTPTQPVADRSWAYWRVRAIDEHGLAGNWSALKSFFNNNSVLDQSPDIVLLTPAEDIVDATGSVNISWADNDADSNASISLYYDTDTLGADGTLIVAGIPEDPDGGNDSYSWDISSLPPGSYYIYAVISDAGSSSTVYLPARISIPQPQQAWTDISSQLQVEFSNPLRSRRSPDATVKVVVRNTGSTDLSGPFRLVIDDLQPDAAVALKTGYGLSDNGQPYFDLTPYINGNSIPAGAASRELSIVISGGGRTSFNLQAHAEQRKPNAAPDMQFVEPATAITDATQAPVVIRWTDTDPDSNASIALFYDTDTRGADGTLIVAGIQEDPDGSNDSYSWDASGLAPGTYYLYAVISDSVNSRRVYLPTPITVPAPVPQWRDVNAELLIDVGNPARSRRSPDARVDIRIENPGGRDMKGPMRLVVTSLTPATTVSLVAPDGTTASGLPYYDLAPYLSADTLSAGASTVISLTITGGGRNSFDLRVSVEQFR